MTTPAQTAPYTACCGSTDDDSEMPDATTQSVSAASRWEAPSIGLETPPSSAASAAGARGDEAALQAAWAALGRPEEHEGPSEGEQDDLNDPRHRRRGRTQQRARLKRGWQRLERARAEAAAEGGEEGGGGAATSAAGSATASSDAAGADADAVAPPPEPPQPEPLLPEPPEPPPLEPPEPSPPPPTYPLSEGAFACIHGLTARPTLNGTLVILGAWHDDRGRWEAWRFDAPGERGVLVRAENLRVDEEARHATELDCIAARQGWVRLVDVGDRPELDGYAAQPLGWDAGRWWVRVYCHTYASERLIFAAHQLAVLDRDDEAAAAAEGEAAHAACVAGSAERMARERAAEDAANDADEAGRAAIDAYHCPPIASDIPVSPIGYFITKGVMLEHHNLHNTGEPYAHQEFALSKTIAWITCATSFCCVGRRKYIVEGCEIEGVRTLLADEHNRGRVPHNVDVPPNRPARALAHMLKIDTHMPQNPFDVRVEVKLQCSVCGAGMLERDRAHERFFSPPISERAFLAKLDMLRQAAARERE